MKLKEFFNPTWNKLLLFFALELLFTLILLTLGQSAFSFSEAFEIIKTILSPTSFLSTQLASVMVNLPPSQESLVVISITLSIIEVVQLIYRYTFACLIVWIYNKVRKK